MGLRKFKKDTKPPTIWLTVFGDLTTNLTLFFILLFYTALIAVQRNLGPEDIADFRNAIVGSVQKSPQKKKMEDTVERLLKTEGISGVAVSEREMKMTLPENVLFEPGKAFVTDAGKVVLDCVGRELRSMPYDAVIEGHTDDLPLKSAIPPGMPRWEQAIGRSSGKGPFRSNWELSAARALKVMEYLTRNAGVPAGRCSINACGPAHPAVPNTSEENRAKNRRIEIRVITKA